MLIADASGHESQLEQARATNPAWYVEEQSAGEMSPWRHNLRKRQAYVEARLVEYLTGRGETKADALLDLGCGDGTNLVWLARYGERLYGSDYNMIRLARARARGTGATLFLADILDYPVLDAFFDVVFFNHVIEHIPDDCGAVATVFRVLKPGGLLILGTPNEGSWWWQIAYRRAPEIRASTDHVHFYTAETIGARMQTAGFNILDVEHLGWGPPDFKWDMHLRQHKLLNDLFDAVGRVLLPKQASSLYLVASRPT